jgi:N5-(cytidine 5'-diphosphoramidyl)-L-glutamine hydrolase
MKRLRIALSQRQDAVPGRDEVREALDVRWGRLLWELGFLPLPLTAGVTDHASYINEIAPDGFLLTGGPNLGVWPARDALERAALEYSIDNNLPVLGVCRGMQFINNFQGGSLRPMVGHTATRHEVSGPLMSNGPRSVNSYHDLVMQDLDLGDDIEAVAWTQDGFIEALRHSARPWLGIMWHPEREAKVAHADHELILNHFRGAS